MLLVKTGYEVASKFRGKNVVTKIGNKKHQVYFKLYCDDMDIADCIKLYKENSNIVMLEYQGTDLGLMGVDLKGVYITKIFDFGTNISENDITDTIKYLQEGLTAIIRVPQEYKDMKFIYDMSNKYSNIRFCGGTVFCLDGCKLGCCGRDILDKKGIKYDATKYIYEGCCCALETLMDTDVELEEGSIIKKSGTGVKKTLKFQDLLYKNGRVSL